MAATIRLHVWTGANANTDGGSAPSFSFLSADSANNTLADRINDPLTIPAAGCTYSYEKWISACVSVAPANSVGNFQYWSTFTASTPPAGTCILSGTAACASGATPVNTLSTVATTDFDGATSGGKGTWDAASYSDAACQTAYIVLQMQVWNAACVGNWATNGCDLSYSYDEV